MKKITKIAILILLAGLIILFNTYFDFDKYLTVENLKKNRDLLQRFVRDNYFLSVLSYIILYICTAFFLPGAVAMTIAGGLLFGVFFGTIYVIIGATIGATLAFLTSRYLIGNWLQLVYKNQLKRFNEELARHSYYYLLLIRMVPLIPFFLINYLAGLTKVPIKVFLLTYFVILIPGTIIYTYVGHQLGRIESLDDILSIETLLAIVLLLVAAIVSFVVFMYLKSAVNQKNTEVS